MNDELYLRRLGKIVYNARKEKNLTQKQVCEKIQLRPGNLTYIEGGFSEASFMKVATLLKSLGLSIDHVLEEIFK